MKIKSKSAVATVAPKGKKFGFDGVDFFAALRERGFAVELDQSADWVTVNGEWITCGEFCRRFPWNGWHSPLSSVDRSRLP